MTESENAAHTTTAAHDLKTDADIESVEKQIARNRAAALAKNSQKTYDTGWRNWSKWASDNSHPDLPADPEHLQFWLVNLVRQKMKPTTIGTYLAAVSNRHSSLPGPNPAQDPEVRQLLAGLNRTSREEVGPPRQAAPIRWRDIERIIDTAHIPRRNQPGGRIETTEQARQRALTDIAMIALAHDAALRSSELLALRWGDIETSQGNGINVVRIRWSKTDQKAQGAVAAMADFTAQAIASIKPINVNPDDRVFDMSPSTLARRIRAAAEAAGLDPANITSHSPRLGMAQDLAAAGVPMPGLMQAGRWKSAATAVRYTEHLLASDTPAGQYLRTQRYQGKAA